MEKQEKKINEFKTSFKLMYSVVDEDGKEIGSSTRYEDAIDTAKFFAINRKVYVVGICACLEPSAPKVTTVEEQLEQEKLDNF